MGLGLVSKGVDENKSGNIITKRQFINFGLVRRTNAKSEEKTMRKHTLSVCLSKGTQKHRKWYVVVVCGFAALEHAGDC